MWHCHHGVRLMGCWVVKLMFHKSHLNVYVVGYAYIHVVLKLKLARWGRWGGGQVRRMSPFMCQQHWITCFVRS